MEQIAVSEAKKLSIPIIAITDTNCDPDQVDYVIPGNDDAIRSIKLITSRIADACIEGAQRRKDHVERDSGDRGDRGDRGEQRERGGPGGRPREEVSVYRGGRGGPRPS